MATITLRVDDETRDDLERLARARGTTISDLLRAAIDDLLGKDVERARADVPRNLDMIQRRSLSLLHEILGLLTSNEEGEADYHRGQVQVLNEGFTAEYYREFTTTCAELTPSDCELVWDILDMFTVLEASAAKLGEDALAQLGDNARYALTFRGFDRNRTRESRLLDYATYLIEDGRWTSLADRFSPAHDNGNSHMPTLETYQRMLPSYKAIKDSKTSGRGHHPDAYNFDASELHAMIDASRHPNAGL